MLRRLVLTSAIGLAVLAPGTVIAQQCPDGTPPPCAGTPRRQPFLDDRRWLVLPFDNLARRDDLDVVHEASVTLLYLEMSRWHDVRVVDDGRVIDLLQTIRPGPRLGLQTGLDLARRVGAGKLVMGTLVPEGSSTSAVAAVYDVRSRRRLRSPQVQLTGTDSLRAPFGRLAQQILDLPASNASGTQTTTSTQALRAYVAGLSAARRARFDSAVVFFERAIAHDSTFALAHYRLFSALRAADRGQEAPRHLEAAERLAIDLPMRERSEIQGDAAVRRGNLRERCAIVERLLAWDSLDTYGLHGRGGCVAAPPGTSPVTFESGVPRFTGDWNAALTAYRSVLGLPPTIHTYPALREAVAMLTAPARSHCAIPAGTLCPDYALYVSPILVDHDTLAFVPYVWSEGRDRWQEGPGSVDSRLARFRMAHDLATQFVTDNPDSWQGHYQLASIRLGLGELDAAERELDAAEPGARFVVGRQVYYRRRIEVELARERPERAAPLVDSLYPDAAYGVQQAGVWSVFGRFSGDLDPAVRRGGSLVSLRQAWLPVFTGAVPPDFDTVAQRYGEGLAAADAPPSRASRLREIAELSTILAFQTLRAHPASDTAAAHPLVRFQARFALGDTVRARDELRQLDADLDARAPDALDDGAWVLAAESHVLLGDSSAALAQLRDYVNRWPRFFRDHGRLLYVRPEIGTSTMRLAGRAWLLYGDLAFAAGDLAQARRAFRFVVGLWGGGEPPVQPAVARASAALAQLGN